MRTRLKLLFTAILLAAGAVHAQDVINIPHFTTHVIPISITGFSGEAESVLKFDLSVLGIVAQEPADFTLSGRSDGRVEGTLSQPGGGRPIFSRVYNGGNMRAQAHALANDVVKELRQTAPIFQSRIAFRLKRGSSTEIAVSDYDGYNLSVVTQDGVLVETPTWLPAARGLLYTSWLRGGTEIYEQNLSTGSRRVFAGYPGLCTGAVVSPDGEKVAMVLSKNGSPNLYVSDISGGNLHQLTMTRDEDSSPCWSPDSREICFTCRSGRAILERISADGGDAVHIPISGVYGNLTSPDWSPDGTTIAFTSGSGNFHIWVVSAHGGEATLEADGEDPWWAPNSRTIIFTQRAGDKHVLSLLDVPTKHVKTVRQISGSCSEPSWAR